MMKIIAAHDLLKVFFCFILVFACADIYFFLNRSQKALNSAQNVNFSISSLFCWPFFVTIATVEVYF